MTSIDKTKALTSPSSIFKRPREVVASSGLSRAEKSAILKQWELDARLLQVASEEGMGGGEQSLLSEVKTAQKAIDADELKERGARSKTGP